MPYSIQAEEEELEKLEVAKEKLKEQIALSQKKLLAANGPRNKFY